MGRPKKPVNVLLNEGKTHMTKAQIKKRKEEEALMQCNADNIECPDWITNETAKKEYNKLSTNLKELGIITNLDVNMLASYCIAYANYIRVTNTMADQPLLLEQTNKAGFTNIIENPLIRIQLKYSDEMKKIASQMGLSISSRMQLVVPVKKDKKDEVSEEFDNV